VRRPNAWHAAVIEHLRAAGEALTVEQIWQRMKAGGFKHKSKMPRGTLGARVTELTQMNKITRVGPATYQLATAQPQQPQVFP
jgi:hypothetical protein